MNRLEKRAEYDAYERRQEEEERDDEDEDEDEDEEEAEADEEIADEAEEPEEEEAPKKPAKKKEPKEPKPKPKSRSRTAKVVRMRMVWGVFNNSNTRVATFDYPKKHEAEEHAAKLTAEKKSTHFVQPVKEPMEEKKE
jgi:hypothetical protein